ncbi:MAG TPA: GPW/gp25 family protein [Polyangiaceae bacterium]|nr:GPW/gp25 family protein [Polyangiaceae bacterium]
MNIAFPYQIDGRGRTASATDDEHLRQLIEQFLFTNAGERVNRPDFGSGLLQMVFEPGGPELASALKFTIISGLQRWLGDLIEIDQLEITAEDSTLRVLIEYRPRGSNDKRVAELTRPVKS